MKKLILVLLAVAGLAGLAAFASAASQQDDDIKVPKHQTPKVNIPRTPEPRYTIEPEGFGQIAKHRRYKYYPDKQVYYDNERKLWFGISDGRWSSYNSAPRGLDTRVDWSVTVEIGSERPYDRHDEVKRRYPGGKRWDSYREGYQDGYEEGYRDAYRDGYNAAYERAYREGYREGYRDGDRSDRRPGEDRGRKEGWDKRDDRR